MDKQTKFNATRAILNALYAGRKLSQLNCKEFMVEDMRTYVSHLKRHYSGTHDLHSEWIKLNDERNVRIKRWWLVKREEQRYVE